MSAPSTTTLSRRTPARTPAPPSGRVPRDERIALLRAVTESITGRGRVLGPAGTWVRLDFDDLRGQLGAG